MSDDEIRQITQDYGGDDLNRRVAYAVPDGKPFPNLQFWQTIEAQLEQCCDILEESGFARDDFNTDGHKEPYQDAWYAAQVGWRCRMVLDARAEGKSLHEAVLLRILQIGTYANEWQWRLTYRPDILTGGKQRKTLADHRGEAHRKLKDGVTARRAEIARMSGDTDLTGGALANYIQRRLNCESGIIVSLRTIRRDLRELRAS